MFSSSQTTLQSPVKQIKDETKHRHKALEEILGAQYFENGALDRSRFVKLLRAYYGLYRTLDPALEETTERFLRDYAYRPRSERLKQDLQTLGLKQEDLDELPTLASTKLPDLDDRSELLGALYVVEGSELGGSIIRRDLEQKLDEETLKADAYVRDRPDETRANWNEFREVFNQRIDSEDALERAVRTANQIFQVYEDWLS